jgi:hypothetical protein
MKLNNFDLKNNFWDVNGNFLILEEFKELYDTDKSKKKEQSSTFMWCLSLLLHPDSLLFNVSISDRRNIIANEYLHDSKFDWSTVEKYVQLYQKLVLTSAQRQLVLWTRFMDEKSEFMSTLSYKNNWEEIEKMLLSNSKLYSELERISEQLEKEGAEGDVKGGAEESASEQGLI